MTLMENSELLEDFMDQDVVNNTLHAEGTHKSDIRLDLDWVSSALPPNKILFQLIRAIYPNADNFEIVDAFGISLSVLIADAISRFHPDFVLLIDLGGRPMIYDSCYRRWDEMNGFNSINMTELNIKALQNGYSYSMYSALRRIAAAILVHVIIGLSRTILVVKCEWRSPALKSLREVFVLAMNSPNTESLQPPPGTAKVDTGIQILKARQATSSAVDFVLYDTRKAEGVSLEDIAK